MPLVTNPIRLNSFIEMNQTYIYPYSSCIFREKSLSTVTNRVRRKGGPDSMRVPKILFLMKHKLAHGFQV